MLLKNRNAVIYGAGGAVGGAVAKAFAREGARVFLAGRTRETLAVVAGQIEVAGGRAEIVPVDATDCAAVQDHLQTIADAAGAVKIMFNALGLEDSQGRPLTDHSLDEFIAPIVTGMKTWFATGTACARHMAANGGGVILGISANAAREAYTEMGGFGIASCAIEHFIRHLAKENGPYGVRACCVRSPGSPDSPGVREVWEIHAADQGMTLADFEKKMGEGVPLRRITPLAQIADIAVLLASDLAAAMTATVVNGTGGAQVD